jgi:hypothetical protein
MAGVVTAQLEDKIGYYCQNKYGGEDKVYQ